MPKKGNRKLRGKGAYYPGGRVLRGRGGFFDDLGGILKPIAKPLLGLAGNALDTVIPGAGSVASGISRLVGLGAYQPVSGNKILAQPVPKVHSSSDQGIRYRHEEYLGDVTGSQDWELTQFHINPGLPETFPWLSTIASSFQKYRIDGLVFYLRSTSSVAIASSDNLALGTVLGAFQYNVYDQPPVSKPDMLALSGSLSGKPSEDHIYPMECDPKKVTAVNHLVRHSGVADDLAKYDHATFNLATTSFPGEYSLGELWVSYDILLMAPKVEDAMPFCFTANQTALALESSGPDIYLVPVNLGTRNTLGWSVDSYSDGKPVWSIPAGTTGTYLWQTSLRTATSAAVQTQYTTWTVLNLPGTASVTVNKVSIWPAWSGTQGVNTAFTNTVLVNIKAPPDQPLLLRPTLVGAGEVGAATMAWFISRVSDNLVPASTTSRGVVASGHKVKRHDQSVSRHATPLLVAREPADGSSGAPVPSLASGSRQSSTNASFRPAARP